MIPSEVRSAHAVIRVLALFLVPFVLQAQTPAPSQTTPLPEQKPASRPHRVITNDDIPSRTPGNSTPEIEARLAQLNFCDRACFAQVFKDSQLAFRQRNNYHSQFSSKDDHAFEDAILSRMQSLRANAEWQNLLRNALIAQDGFCRASNGGQQLRARQGANRGAITAADLAAEARAAKDAPPIPNYNAATSAIINYKFRIEKDFLLAAIVLYKYFEIVHTDCSSYRSEE